MCNIPPLFGGGSTTIFGAARNIPLIGLEPTSLSLFSLVLSTWLSARVYAFRAQLLSDQSFHFVGTEIRTPAFSVRVLALDLYTTSWF